MRRVEDLARTLEGTLDELRARKEELVHEARRAGDLASRARSVWQELVQLHDAGARARRGSARSRADSPGTPARDARSDSRRGGDTTKR